MLLQICLVTRLNCAYSYRNRAGVGAGAGTGTGIAKMLTRRHISAYVGAFEQDEALTYLMRDGAVGAHNPRCRHRPEVDFRMVRGYERCARSTWVLRLWFSGVLERITRR